ncbi:hypothetical protein DFH06DRAFT_1418740 [Mycena polygramma]|nr:hypothetical protein DFH06DRAFT_1418740 [Mycena polygramma]
MRLMGNKSRYNRLMNICRYSANRFLNTNKTISGQDKPRLEKTIQKKHFKYFQRFAGAWPARAFIKQYLANTCDKYKRAVRLERAAELEDTDDWSAAAQGAVEEEEEEDARSDADAGDDFGAGDVELDFDDVDSDADMDMDTDQKQDDLDFEDFAQTGDDEEFQDLDLVHSPVKDKKKSDKKKRAAPDTPSEENERPEKKAKSTSATSNASKTRLFTHADIPITCPDPHCDDSVPKSPSAALVSLFAQKLQLVQEKGPTDSGCRQLTRKICRAIEEAFQPERYQAMSADRGWRTPIDFKKLPARISAMLPGLTRLLTESDFLSKTPIWNRFLDKIDHRVFALSQSSSDFEDAYQGFISDALRKTLPQALGETIGSTLFCEAIENTLFDTLECLIDKPHPWDEHDSASNLISVKKFTHFVLVPQVAATLIAQDMECNDTEAVDVLEDSRRCGEVLNPVVVETANEVSAAPPRHDRKKLKQVNLLVMSYPDLIHAVDAPISGAKLPKQKIITLDDFTPLKDTKPKAKPKAPVKTTKPTPGMDATPSKKTTSTGKGKPKATSGGKEKKEKKVVVKVEPTRKSARNTEKTKANAARYITKSGRTVHGHTWPYKARKARKPPKASSGLPTDPHRVGRLTWPGDPPAMYGLGWVSALPLASISYQNLLKLHKPR